MAVHEKQSQPEWLVLCHSYDSAAEWACAGLRHRGLTQTALITDTDLSTATLWEHRLATNGAAITIQLDDGRTVRSDRIQGVLNRFVTTPTLAMALVNPSDRDYYTQELTAFYMSWLYALPGLVLNRPTAQGLGGSWRTDAEWQWLAGQAGLPTTCYCHSTANLTPTFQHPIGNSQSHIYYNQSTARLTNWYFVVANRVIRGITDESAASPMADRLRLAEGCHRLAELAKTALLGVEFTFDKEGHPTFLQATPWPDLRLGGDPLLDLLAETFTAQSVKRGATS